MYLKVNIVLGNFENKLGPMRGRPVLYFSIVVDRFFVGCNWLPLRVKDNVG